MRCGSCGSPRPPRVRRRSKRARASATRWRSLQRVAPSSRWRVEALEALARARQAQDGGGEAACARFLADLSTQNGSESARTVWEQVGN